MIIILRVNALICWICVGVINFNHYHIKKEHCNWDSYWIAYVIAAIGLITNLT